MKKILLSTLLSSILFTTLVDAVEVTQEQKIMALYVSYFKRAADQDGLEYWRNRSEEALSRGEDGSSILKELSKGFAGHEIFISTYSDLDNQDFVEAIYQNSLGKIGDIAGINYWVNLLNSGKSRSDMVSEFVDSSLSTDLTSENYPVLSVEDLSTAQKRQDLITNKVNIALSFTDGLGKVTNLSGESEIEDDPAYIASMKIIQGVTEEASTLLKAEDYIKTILDDTFAINKINDEFKWINDIILNVNQSTICTKTTPFEVEPKVNPIVMFTTDVDSLDTTISVETGSLTILNCTEK